MNFDLNLKNYSTDELEKMLQLPDTYDIKMIESKHKDLTDTITKNRDLNQEDKDRIKKFLDDAKTMIVSVKKKDEPEIPAYIKRIYKIDPQLGETKVEVEGGSNMIQQRNPYPWQNVNVRAFVPGLINQVARAVNRQFLNIDTRFRPNYYASQSTNFNMTLPIRIKGVLSMQLTAFEMPVTFYNISKQNGSNFFEISIDDTSETAIITVATGNYTIDTLLTYINTQLQNLGGSFAKLVFTTNLVSSTSGSAQVIVGILSPNTPFNFTLNFQTDINGFNDYNTPLMLKLGWLMGFRAGKYINNSAYVTEGVPALTGPRYIFLVIDDHNNNFTNGFYDAFTLSFNSSNILARLSVQSSSYQLMSQNNLFSITQPRVYLGPVDIEKVNVQLLDEYGRILDLNNMDYSFNLTFETVYDL